MKNGRGKQLAAAFVVTVAATGCKKQGFDPDGGSGGEDHASVSRNGDVCRMHVPQHCTKGAFCNPPDPPEIDCPAENRDASEADPSPARPAGKSAWLRVKPHLWVGQYGCSYSTAYFCTPPAERHHCDSPGGDVASTKLTCTAIEAGTTELTDATARTGRRRYRVEAFVHHDGVGGCRSVPAFECEEGDCIRDMPAGSPAPCTK